jgi:hypothetical protein
MQSRVQKRNSHNIIPLRSKGERSGRLDRDWLLNLNPTYAPDVVNSCNIKGQESKGKASLNISSKVYWGKEITNTTHLFIYG